MIKKLDIKELNNDKIGYVQSYDFSEANTSYEARVEAITTIASVCYANPKAIGSVKLYDRLACESASLPSSSYEFVPILLNWDQVIKICNVVEKVIKTKECTKIDTNTAQVEKYGEWLEVNGYKYLLTNLRALINDIGDNAQNEEYFNTNEEEIKIIKDNFKVYQAKIDLSTSRQFVRHRGASFQELSRRYVSGKKQNFEFYKSSKMDFISEHEDKDDNDFNLYIDDNDFYQICIDRYNQAIKRGIKPEEARRCLPQSMYTTIWSAWQPKQLENFYKLRLNSHAQKEIRCLAENMKELDNKNIFNYKIECKDCSMLIKEENEDWICDEIGKKCSEITECSYNKNID